LENLSRQSKKKLSQKEVAMVTKAIIFDYIGTLVNCTGYSMDASRRKLYAALADEGFDIDENQFLNAYDAAHEKYRKIRYGELREVTNAIWVAEALCKGGFTVDPHDNRVKAALNVFFEDFINTLELRSGAKQLLTQTKTQYKVGLVSNFTHAPVIHKSLRKLDINQCFNAIVISEETGWRKPSGEIFQDVLSRLQVKVDETVYVGDSPVEDIKGAKDAGLKTVFVASQFHTLDDLEESKIEPAFIAKDLQFVCKNLNQIISI
jgi:HAD superfamily hydrolase (TIGR01662 family)